MVEVEEALATIEELMDKEGMDRLRKAEDEYRKGEYVVVKTVKAVGKLIE